MSDTAKEGVGAGAADADRADHHGQDEGRETLSAGEAQREAGALGDQGEQRLPAMAQNNAPAGDKIAGIVAQTRSDVGTDTLDSITHVLSQRLEQSGLSLPDDEIEKLAREVSAGSSTAAE